MSRAEKYLVANYFLNYNNILGKVEYASKKDKEVRDLTDYKINSLIRELRINRITVTKSELTQMLRSEFVRQYDPFAQYFNSLPAWDLQTDYIEQLANTVVVSPEEVANWKLYLKRWLIGVVACAIHPHEINQTVLVLVGGQGIGKTKWMDRLVPRQLSKYYYSGNINPNDKDTKINLGECLLINMDELENLNKGEIGTLKQLISLPSIRVRRPYSTIPENMIRRASFMGSVNNLDFLRDDTGNRRFLCVEALEINYLHQISMENVYAQALHLYKNGERYWFNNEENMLINEANEKYKVSYPEIDLVNEHYEPCPAGIEPDFLLTVTELVKKLNENKDSPRNLSANRLGIVMKGSPYKRTKIKGSWKWKLNTREKEQY